MTKGCEVLGVVWHATAIFQDVLVSRGVLLDRILAAQESLHQAASQLVTSRKWCVAGRWSF